MDLGLAVDLGWDLVVGWVADLVVGWVAGLVVLRQDRRLDLLVDNKDNRAGAAPALAVSRRCVLSI